MTKHFHYESVEQGSNNIFADLGFPNPEEHLAKAGLAVQITEIVQRRRLSDAEAADILDIDRPSMSALMRGQFRNFSLDLMRTFTDTLRTIADSQSP